MIQGAIGRIEDYRHGTVTFSVVPPNQVVISGTIATVTPDARCQSYMRKVHEAAQLARVDELVVDVKELSFVNSSAIRLFVDWVMWLRATLPQSRYRLVFVGKRNITWQKIALGALKSLAPEIVEVRLGLDPSSNQADRH